LSSSFVYSAEAHTMPGSIINNIAVQYR